jgi:hypothetical protein
VLLLSSVVCGDGAINSFLLFLRGKSETYPPARLILKCNARRDIRDVWWVCLFFTYGASLLGFSYVVRLCKTRTSATKPLKRCGIN